MAICTLHGAGTITAGDQFGASVRSGTLRTWGLNDTGQLGQGTTGGTNPVPTVIDPNSTYSLVEAGPDFMFGITDSGDLNGWGSNTYGQLGIGSTTSQSSPASINIANSAVEVAAGADHALAINSLGYLYAWGSIELGQLGLGVFQDPVAESLDDTVVETPIRVGTSTWLDVAAGNQFTVAVRSDNTLWIWGGGAIGVLGLTPSNFLSPVQVTGSTGISWAEVEAGDNHVIALTTNGRIYTWGINAVGQLGLGNTTSKTTPTRVGTASDWTYIAAGSSQSYAINSSGMAYGWGLNSSEQLGLDVTVNLSGMPYNYRLLSPTLMASGVFNSVDGGRDVAGSGGSLPDGTEVIGFTLLAGTPTNQAEGIFSLGGNVSGQLGNGSTSYSTSYTLVKTTADGASIEISGTTIDSATLGVNASTEVIVTVENTGSVNIEETYYVTLYLSTSSTYNPNSPGDVLGSVTVSDDLNVGDSKELPFFPVTIPGDKSSGTFYLISRVYFADDTGVNPADGTVDSTAITIVRPDIQLQNLSFEDGTTIDYGEDFTNVTLEMTNGTIGIVPELTDITISAYLINNVDFDPSEDTLTDSDKSVQLIPSGETIYSGGLNAYNAEIGSSPPVLVDFGFSTLDVPDTQNSREYFMIVFVVNEGDSPSEEDGVTENNYLTQVVRIKSPNSVAPAIGFGDLQGQSDDIGKSGEWEYISDQFALNGDALQSPYNQSREMSLQVVGPTNVSAPWLLNAGDGSISYSLTDADGNTIDFVGSAPILDYYEPNYQPLEIVINQQSDLYVDGENHPYPWTITWSYIQGGSSVNGYARVDLEVPNFVPDSNSFVFLGVDDESSPLGDGRVVSIDLDDGDFAAGDSAIMNLSYDFTGTSLVKFWWRTDGDAGFDTFSFSIDGVVQAKPTKAFGVTATTATLTGNSAWQQVAFIVSGGPHTLRWSYSKTSDNPNANAYIDGLQILDPLPDTNVFNRTNPNPNLIPVISDPGDWVQIVDTNAPNEQAYEISGVPQTESKSFTFDLGAADLDGKLDGAGVILAPWMISSTTSENDGDADTLSYTLFAANDAPIPAASGAGPFTVELVGGVTSYQTESIVINQKSELYDADDSAAYPYPWKIQWTYTQNSADGDAYARVAPTAYSFIFVPVSNVDMAIQSVVLTEGTYILDDAEGTGRLPISVSVKNVGANFDVGSPASTTDDFLDPTNLSVHLSLDQIYGNSDDVNLGNFAQSNVLSSGNQIIFQAELNLPFTTPAGNYYVLVRFDSSAEQGEFTLNNNEYNQGPGFVIVRAPDLSIGNAITFSDTYPYRPEQLSYIEYDIRNLGLGTITESDEFSVEVGMYAKLRTSDEATNSIPIKIYDAIEHSLFLPELSAQYPNGGSSHVVHQLEIPSVRDILVALGSIPAGTSEDDNEVDENLYDIELYSYFFIINVDVFDNILESSETNLSWLTSSFFTITPVTYQATFNDTVLTLLFENYGLYTSQFAFSRYVITADPALSLTNPNAALVPGYPELTALMAYALGLNPTPGYDPVSEEDYAQTAPLYRPDYANGIFNYNIEPYGSEDFLAMTFDFNVRASDLTINVQAGDDPNNLSTILSITPPYTAVNGEQSLTGFNGLIYEPVVMALEGNVSSVQQVYTARITVRDSVPYDGARFMRLQIESNSAQPSTVPDDLTGTIYYEDSSLESVILTWTGAAVYDPNDDTLNGAYHIERRLGTAIDFELIGVLLTPLESGTFRYDDESVSAGNTYTYRVRPVSSAGTTGTYSNVAVVAIPNQ